MNHSTRISHTNRFQRQKYTITWHEDELTNKISLHKWQSFIHRQPDRQPWGLTYGDWTLLLRLHKERDGETDLGEYQSVFFAAQRWGFFRTACIATIIRTRFVRNSRWVRVARIFCNPFPSTAFVESFSCVIVHSPPGGSSACSPSWGLSTRLNAPPEYPEVRSALRFAVDILCCDAYMYALRRSIVSQFSQRLWGIKARKSTKVSRSTVCLDLIGKASRAALEHKFCTRTTSSIVNDQHVLRWTQDSS